MNISVVRAVELNSLSDDQRSLLKDQVLRTGYPFLICESTQVIIEPVFRFVWQRHGTKGRYVENTALADVDDLRDWYQFLAHFKVKWDAVQRQHIEQYRDYMLKLISPKTNEAYSVKTVKRRVGTVLAFYRHFNARHETSVDLGDKSQAIRRPIDENMLAHVSRGVRACHNPILPASHSGIDDGVRAFNVRQYRLVAHALGSLPNYDRNDTRPVRDRLWAELCLHSGMRPGEPINVTVHAILDLTPEDPENQAGLTFLRVHGKGNKVRKVEVPNLVLKWLHWYIDHERRDAIAEGRRRGNIVGRNEPSALFLNGTNARHNAGKPATYDSFQSAFRNAVLAAASSAGQTAGLMRIVLKVEPDTQQSYTLSEPAFTGHCLRHTYAVWSYLAEREQGNVEPWKILQARLGHAELATTINTYLRIAGDFEAQLSDRVAGSLAAILRDSQG